MEGPASSLAVLRGCTDRHSSKLREESMCGPPSPTKAAEGLDRGEPNRRRAPGRVRDLGDLPLAEFLLEECDFPVHHSARPRASIAVFWQDPAKYPHHEEARERVLQEIPAQLADRKARARVMGRSCMRNA
ncbi:hypothetical protein, unlikely [Trypanosoma congolense IL3000]|uniref:Uncharacterized protein n=1 Tax=Trypanosoma congolense (strain IL3000) TaxID=1068625 RepID=F9WBS7_TRYCI|nr:hypothetical protein, unlikely [Trypanosoma congolense IL3000]